MAVKARIVLIKMIKKQYLLGVFWFCGFCIFLNQVNKFLLYCFSACFSIETLT